MWYIYCCHAWFGQQCGLFTVAMLCLDNNVIPGIFTVAMLGLDNNVIHLTKHVKSKYTTLLSKESMATVNMSHCCLSQA
jgi:hypothetical protein